MLVDDRLLLLGIRHHGPGSAASMVKALEQFAPDVILIEGAQECQGLLEHIVDNDLKPPVAQLVYASDDHRDSVFFPHTEFSPEYQALLYAAEHEIETRYFDLPQTHSLALNRKARERGDVLKPDLKPHPKPDPLQLLAQSAGYSDGELWWEHVVEQHQQGIEVFSAIANAMSAVRERLEADEQGVEESAEDLLELRREAWMRRQLRQALKEPWQRIAVVCGAWHVPALTKKVKIKDDNELLKGLPKIKLQSTWVPWSYERISRDSGYGAGVSSPGWYHHLWQYFKFNALSLNKEAMDEETVSEQNDINCPTHTCPTVSWLTMAARVLRRAGYDVAPASVIDAVRLAQSMAALNYVDKPSLQDMNDTIVSVLCFGDSTPMVLLKRQLLISERLGRVPSTLPVAPLKQDLQAKVSSLRLKLNAEQQTVNVDLRKEVGQKRSALFHQLSILNINWGEQQNTYGSKGTFKEVWLLDWQVDFELNLIEFSRYGHTIAQAASNFALEKIKQAKDLAELCNWLEKLLLAQLSDAVTQVIALLNERAALTHDVEQLLGALPPLAQVLRYGDVRDTDVSAVNLVVESFVQRICIGLPKLCININHDSAERISDDLNQVQQALQMLKKSELLALWYQALGKICDYEQQGSAMVAGRCYRLLLASEQIDETQAANGLSLALSRGQSPEDCAFWIEGLLSGAGLLLVHNDDIWQVLDNYLCSISDDAFDYLVPLLRRTFSTFESAEKQNLIVRAKRFDGGTSSDGSVNDSETEDGFDFTLANQSLPLSCLILGLNTADSSVDSSSDSSKGQKEASHERTKGERS